MSLDVVHQCFKISHFVIRSHCYENNIVIVCVVVASLIRNIFSPVDLYIPVGVSTNRCVDNYDLGPAVGAGGLDGLH